MERSKTAAWCLAALIAIATCGGCTLVPFTDVVERDPDAPLTRAAEKAWSDCIVSNVDTQARDPRRLRASDLASVIISACRDEKSKVVELADAEHFKSLANGLDRMYSPAAVAVMLELARAKREGIGAINTPGWDGLMNGITQAELDSRLLQWDECSEAAVPFLAKGNPQDRKTTQWSLHSEPLGTIAACMDRTSCISFSGRPQRMIRMQWESSFPNMSALDVRSWLDLS